MMKKLLALVLVLGMASMASAAISLIGPDEITLDPSDWIEIGIDAGGEDASIGLWILVQGPGSIDNSGAVLWEDSDQLLYSVDDPGTLGEFIPLLGDLGYPGVVDIYEATIKDVSEPFSYPVPGGEGVQGLMFHCDGPGDVILTLMDLDLNAYDAILIHQTPEPASMALLGLGALFLRRRK